MGTVIDEEGANLRSGPELDYAIVDKRAKGHSSRLKWRERSEDGRGYESMKTSGFPLL